VNDHELALARNIGEEWAGVNESEPINQANVQSLVNTLANLRAVRWAGASAPSQALDKPQLTITFTISDEEEPHKLIVGGPADNGMWYAHTDDHEGTFVMSNPDLSSLRAPLIGAPPATPGATDSPTP